MAASTLFRVCGVFALVTIVGLIGTFASPHSDAAVPATKPAANEGGIAVVELFTSEGCSSCPPADAALADIASDATRRGLRVFPIAFHVDYWDGLGWKDRFGSPAASSRQMAYARALGTDPYTPQMIVNGRAEFLGSDRSTGARQISAALEAPAVGGLTLEARPGEGQTLKVGYHTSDVPADSVLNLVAVERNAQTDVPRGENAGRTLQHVNVARAFQAVPLTSTTGSVDLRLPPDVTAKEVTVIGFVQDAKSMRIYTAGSAEVATR